MNIAGTTHFSRADEFVFSALGMKRVLAKVLICDVLFSVSLYSTGSKSAISARETKFVIKQMN
jgi:hypothetical protein